MTLQASPVPAMSPPPAQPPEKTRLPIRVWNQWPVAMSLVLLACHIAIWKGLAPGGILALISWREVILPSTLLWIANVVFWPLVLWNRPEAGRRLQRATQRLVAGELFLFAIWQLMGMLGGNDETTPAWLAYIWKQWPFWIAAATQLSFLRLWWQAADAITLEERAGEVNRGLIVGSVGGLAIHYLAKEWIFHPQTALWKEPLFWSGLFWILPVAAVLGVAAALALGSWKKGNRLLLKLVSVLAGGDLLWFLVWQGWTGPKKPPGYWGWWPAWFFAMVLGGVLVFFFKAVCARGWDQPIRRLFRAMLQWPLLLLYACLLLGATALGLTLAHLAVPRLTVAPWTLSVAREILIPKAQESRFDFLTQNPTWEGLPMHQLLDHLQLSQLQRTQFYPDLSEAIFMEAVLSPDIAPMPLPEYGWRRVLWENCYRQIKTIKNPEVGASTVLEHLRSRITLDKNYRSTVGPETIWIQQAADASGFQVLYVAALRSVGIAARLAGDRSAEIWTGTGWKPAPRSDWGELLPRATNGNTDGQRGRP